MNIVRNILHKPCCPFAAQRARPACQARRSLLQSLRGSHTAEPEADALRFNSLPLSDRTIILPAPTSADGKATSKAASGECTAAAARVVWRSPYRLRDGRGTRVRQPPYARPHAGTDAATVPARACIHK